MVVDPNSLLGIGQVIVGDRPCVGCGYNLKGLETGGVCPECGLTIKPKRTKGRYCDNLIDAPIWYIRVVAFGSGLMGSSVLGSIFWVFVTGMYAFRGGTLGGAVSALLPPLLFVAWIGGVMLVTVRRPFGPEMVRDDILDDRRLRWIARGGQLMPALAIALFIVAGLLGSGVLAAVAGIVSALSLFGLVPLSAYLSALSDWAGDDDAGGRFRTAAWCIAVCGSASVAFTLLTFVTAGGLNLLFAWAAGVMGLVATIGGILLLWSVVQLAWTSVWAVRNWHESREREERILQKHRERAQREAERAATADAASETRPSGGHDLPVLDEDDGFIPLAEATAPGADAEGPKIRHADRKQWSIEQTGTAADEVDRALDRLSGGRDADEEDPRRGTDGPQQERNGRA